jgi:hypothetical protein
MREQGKCIFCKGTGLSKEHVWPDWLKNVFPREVNNHSQTLIRTSFGSVNKTASVQPEFKSKQGHVGTKTVRNVCAACNNGWMSELEEKNKQTITSLALGEEIVLNSITQQNLALWAAMKTIVAEYTDVSTISISEADRETVIQGQVPTDGWGIWIGRYKGKDWVQRYYHCGASLTTKAGFVLGLNSRPSFNTQSSVFVVGELLIYITSTGNMRMAGTLDYCSNKKLHKVWPLKNSDIIWPFDDIFSDKEVLELGNSIIDFM